MMTAMGVTMPLQPLREWMMGRVAMAFAGCPSFLFLCGGFLVGCAVGWVLACLLGHDGH